MRNSRALCLPPRGARGLSAARPACPRCGSDASPPCAFFCQACGSIQEVGETVSAASAASAAIRKTTKKAKKAVNNAGYDEHSHEHSSRCSHFALLGLPPRFALATEEVRAAYKALQRRLHPDVHHAAAAAEGGLGGAAAEAAEAAEAEGITALAAAHSARINVAADVLSDPVLRAQHLMVARCGVDPLAEDAGSGSSLSDPELLMFVMEERQRIEDLDEFAGSGEADHRAASVDALMAHYQGLFEDAAEGLDAGLDAAAVAEVDGDDAQRAEVVRALTGKVVRMQYLSKLKDECHARIEV